MDYSQFFSAALSRLHDERRYRVFANLERNAARFPASRCGDRTKRARARAK